MFTKVGRLNKLKISWKTFDVKHIHNIFQIMIDFCLYLMHFFMLYLLDIVRKLNKLSGCWNIFANKLNAGVDSAQNWLVFSLYLLLSCIEKRLLYASQLHYQFFLKLNAVYDYHIHLIIKIYLVNLFLKLFNLLEFLIQKLNIEVLSTPCRYLVSKSKYLFKFA